MAIFNSYVSLPEGNIPIFELQSSCFGPLLSLLAGGDGIPAMSRPSLGLAERPHWEQDLYLYP